MPRSKSSSHSPLTAEARWNTPSKRCAATWAHWPSSGPVSARTRGSASQVGRRRELVGEHDALDVLAAERAARKQGARQPRTDETGAAGDQQFHEDSAFIQPSPAEVLPRGRYSQPIHPS